MFLSKKKRIQYLRNRWGKSIEKHRNFDLISAYHSLVKSEKENFVDEKTWNDFVKTIKD